MCRGKCAGASSVTMRRKERRGKTSTPYTPHPTKTRRPLIHRRTELGKMETNPENIVDNNPLAPYAEFLIDSLKLSPNTSHSTMPD